MITLPTHLVARLAELDEKISKAKADAAQAQAKADAFRAEANTLPWGPEAKALHRRASIWSTKSCNLAYDAWLMSERIRGIKGGWFTW